MLTQPDGCSLQGKLALKTQVFHLGGNPWVTKMPFICQQCLKEITSSSPTAALSAIYPTSGAGRESRTASVRDSGSFQKETRGQQLFPRKTFHLQVLGEGKSLLLDQRQEADQTSSSFAPLIQVKPAFCSPFPSPSFFILFHNGMFKKKKYITQPQTLITFI